MLPSGPHLPRVDISRSRERARQAVLVRVGIDKIELDARANKDSPENRWSKPVPSVCSARGLQVHTCSSTPFKSIYKAVVQSKTRRSSWETYISPSSGVLLLSPWRKGLGRDESRLV